MLENRDTELATALVRCFTAQPYLVELIDTVRLFDTDSGEAMEDEDSDFDRLVCHLKEQVYPALETAGDDVAESSQEKNKRLELVQSLLLNKQREVRLVAELEA